MSYILKGHSLADAYRIRIGGSRLILSFQTTAELLAWSRIRHWGEKNRARLGEFIGNCIVVPVTTQLTEVYATIRAEAERRGKSGHTGDVWIAATALLYDVPLVSHNRKHFEWMTSIGLHLITEALD